MVEYFLKWYFFLLNGVHGFLDRLGSSSRQAHSHDTTKPKILSPTRQARGNASASSGHRLDKLGEETTQNETLELTSLTRACRE